ncbi:DUF2637 domain-containing protein [Streptomyces adustus]|uniref:DUF2637 domain-containing protein n=1 Tax=Streptomyces adustus TaxID=1609272 RepID=A0A5N8VQI4_9ACTN|nr:DUF2637 domain-containing protein [Streptomyces adustus]MPY37269.1 DUF2637 domain-containing protein [Streptomyces adustus]
MNLNPSRALAIAAGLVIIALTAAAFWLSYAHLAEVALAHGMHGKEVRAWAWPATLDLFIVAGELLMLRAALKGDVDGWAIGLTVAGSGGSIALNVAGVGSHAELLDYVVAAVPPTAALLAFGALMRQLHQALAERDEQTNRSDLATVAADSLSAATPSEMTTEATVERVDDDQPPALPEPPQMVIPEAVPWHWKTEATAPGQPDDATRKVTASAFAQHPREVVTQVIALTPGELLKRAHRLNRERMAAEQRPVTIAQLQDEFGISRREATELRRQVVAQSGGERS